MVHCLSTTLQLCMTAPVNEAKVEEGTLWLTCVPSIELGCNTDAGSAQRRENSCKEIHCYAWQPLAHATMSENSLC